MNGVRWVDDVSDPIHGAFGVAWPIAVRLTEWLFRARGYVVQTEQSGGDARMDVIRPKLKVG
jgi:hypothetical protein